MSRAAVVAAGLVALGAGCNGASDDGRPPAAPTRGAGATGLPPLALERAPAPAVRTCRASRLLRRICPRRVPAGRYRDDGVALAPVGRVGDRFDVFELVGRRPRAPHVVHIVVLASRYGLGRSAGGVFAVWPTGRAAGLRDGLFGRRRPNPILLAGVGWSGLRGDLVLDRTRPSAAGGHLVFRWQARGVDYAVTLHAWEPLRAAIATLRAVVASTPVAGPRRR